MVSLFHRATIKKAVIENCGQDKSSNSTYKCPRNRHKSIKTIKHKKLLRYSNKIESVGLRKCLYYHYLTEKVMSQ